MSAAIISTLKHRCFHQKLHKTFLLFLWFLLYTQTGIAQINEVSQKASQRFDHFDYTGCRDLLVDYQKKSALNCESMLLLARAYLNNQEITPSMQTLFAIISGSNCSERILVLSYLYLSKIYTKKFVADSATYFFSLADSGEHLLINAEEKAFFYAQKNLVKYDTDKVAAENASLKSLSLVSEDNPFAMDVYESIALKLNDEYKTDSALFWVNKAITLQRSRFEADTNRMVRLNLMKGYILFCGYESADALKLYVEEIKPALFREHHRNELLYAFQKAEFFRFSTLFNAYNGDLYKTITNSDEFLKIAPLFYEDGHVRFGEVFRDLAESYLRLGRIESFVYYIDKAIDIFKTNPYYKSEISFYLAKRNYYSEQFQDAIHHAGEVIKQLDFSKAVDAQNLLTIDIYFSSLRRSEKVELAIKELEDILQICHQSKNMNPVQIQYLYNIYLKCVASKLKTSNNYNQQLFQKIRSYLADYIARKKSSQWDIQSIELINNCNYILTQLNDPGENPLVDSVIVWNTLSGKLNIGLPVSSIDVKSHFSMLESMRIKSLHNRNLFLNKKEEKYLETSLAWAAYFLDWKNRIYPNTRSLNDQLLSQKLDYTITEKILSIASEIPAKYYPQLFNLMERERSRILTGKSSDQLYRYSLKIPDSLQIRELSMVDQISDLTSRLKAFEKYKGRTFYKDLEENLFQANLDLNEFKEYLKTNYGYQYDSSLNYSTVDLEWFQKNLREDELVCYYFSGISHHSVLVISSGRVKLLQLNTPDEDLINRFRTSIDPSSGFDQPAMRFEEYVKSSSQLYDEQLRPILNLFPGYRRLRIVPDGSLHQIPFEALISELPEELDGDYSSLHYLIKDYLISYTSSITHLYNHGNSVQRAGSNGRVLAFAPDYTGNLGGITLTRGQLQNLEWNEEEVEAIEEYFHVDTYVRDQATEIAFKNEAGNYEVLHLAAHAIVNVEEPLSSFLAFSQSENDSENDGILKASEIFNMSLRADLAVLSACNTGSGKIYKGEGALSLALAFSYAGCPSVLMSHWSADDQATSKLMDYFYSGLAEGLQKDEALRNAKLTYLENASEFKKSPVYWNNFSIVGNLSETQLKSNSFSLNLILLIFAALALTGLTSLFVIRSKSVRRKN